MRDVVFVNGYYVDRADAKVSVEDRGYQFADGVYEVVRFHGRRGLRLDQHLDRLARSGGHLRIQGAPSKQQWLQIIDTLVDHCELPDDESQVNCLYQQVTRGDIARVHAFPKIPPIPATVAYFRKAPAYSADLRAAGITLSTQPDERWERCYIKSISLLPAVLAKQAALEAGAFEALLLRDGIVTEGASTNIFCVINGDVHTHPEGGRILSGITRDIVFEAARIAGIKIVQRPVPIDEFRAADEAFICSTTLDIMPATSLDGQPIASGQVGPVTTKLMAAFNQIIADEIHRPVSA